MLPAFLCLRLSALLWLVLSGARSETRYLAPGKAAVALAESSLDDMASALDRLKLADTNACGHRRPFLCPGRLTPAASDDQVSYECIPLEYLCDGTPDCPAYPGVPAAFDESSSVCSALGRRPPPDESESLLRFLVTDNASQATRKLFGARLIKRSGISDQILAEIQMNRALRKQIERAKLAALSGNKVESTTTK